jgi:hypothetical protein
MTTTDCPPTVKQGRAAVRATLYNWLETGNIQNLNQIFTSFPKRINYQVNSQPGQLSRAAVIIFIQNENESRIAIGGAHNGWKRVDYSVILQVYQHSVDRNSQNAMDDFDILIDAIKERLRADHNFGDTTGRLVWQGAEPQINCTYGEPATNEGGATETFAEIQFLVTEMIQA